MRTKFPDTIKIHSAAPAKPEPGEPCNGCGVCCAAEPCPVALVFLFQRTGRCRALIWREEDSRYICGMVASPHRYSYLIPAKLSTVMGRFFSSRIASGIGCDSGIELDD